MSATDPASASGHDAVDAHLVRDDNYLLGAVTSGLLERPRAANVVLPLMGALGIVGLFSPWGFLPFTLLRGGSLNGLALLGALVLVMLSAAGTWRATHRTSLKGYGFGGDAVDWRFGPAGARYSLTTPDGAVRHTMESDWSFFHSLRVHAGGLRLMRTPQEGYWMPVGAFAGDAPAARHDAMQRVVDWVRAAGRPVVVVRSPDAALALGVWAMVSALLLGLLCLASTVAAWPLLRFGGMVRVYASAAELFWWPAPLLALLVMALHGGVWRLQLRAASAERLLTSGRALWPHLALAALWCAALLAGLERLRGHIWDDALASARYGVALPVICALMMALFTGWLVWLHGFQPWTARRWLHDSARRGEP